MTPERLAALEAEKAREEAEANGKPAIDEAISPTAGRRFTRTA